MARLLLGPVATVVVVALLAACGSAGGSKGAEEAPPAPSCTDAARLEPLTRAVARSVAGRAVRARLCVGTPAGFATAVPADDTAGPRWLDYMPVDGMPPRGRCRLSEGVELVLVHGRWLRARQIDCAAPMAG